jgi:hypothetical protein
LIIQSVGEISERIGGLDETSVLLLQCADAKLEVKDAGTQSLTVLSAAAGTAVKTQTGFVCIHEVFIGLHAAAEECDGQFNGSGEWMT